MIDLPVEVGRARIGSAATFALAGALCAVWTVRIPALTDKLHLDPAGVGTAVLLFGVGAMITMQLARVAITRLGSRRTLLLAAPGSAATSAGIGIAPTYPWLLVAAGLFGTAFGALDIGMNAQVAALERVSGRHLMNGAHAGWSVGSVLGGALGALSAYLHMSFTHAVVGRSDGLRRDAGRPSGDRVRGRRDLGTHRPADLGRARHRDHGAGPASQRGRRHRPG